MCQTKYPHKTYKLPKPSRCGKIGALLKRLRAVLVSGEIHCLRRLKREGFPHSWPHAFQITENLFSSNKTSAPHPIKALIQATDILLYLIFLPLKLRRQIYFPHCICPILCDIQKVAIRSGRSIFEYPCIFIKEHRILQ